MIAKMRSKWLKTTHKCTFEQFCAFLDLIRVGINYLNIQICLITVLKKR
jgi:hypothetical protein